jgi:hypothetical protein
MLGVLLAVLVLQLAVWTITRDPSIPFYALFVLTLGVAELFRDAILPTPRGIPPLPMLALLDCIGGLASVGFTIVFLRLRQDARRLFWFLLGGIAPESFGAGVRRCPCAAAALREGPRADPLRRSDRLPCGERPYAAAPPIPRSLDVRDRDRARRPAHRGREDLSCEGEQTDRRRAPHRAAGLRGQRTPPAGRSPSSGRRRRATSVRRTRHR